jgi:hypothetical protein
MAEDEVITLDRLERARATMAYIVRRHGQIYTPLLAWLESEIASRTAVPDTGPNRAMLATMESKDDIGPDDPITLTDACRIVFRDRIKPSTLRAEADRGRLAIERIGRRDFVTLNGIAEMRRLCRVERKPPPRVPPTARANDDPQARAEIASAAARASARALREKPLAGVGIKAGRKT